MNTFVISRINCFDCDYEAITNEGYELNSKFTFNKSLSVKHEMIYGLGFNLWRYRVDIISGWTGESLESKYQSTGLVDMTVGYRYIITEFKNKEIFIENNFHGELNTGNKFNKFKFCVEPGIGFKFQINEKMKFLTIMSYKHSLSDFAGLDHDSQNPYSFGIRLGVSRKL